VLLEEVGARLRARRLAEGLTQAALAQRAGVSVRFLVEIEKGEGNVSLRRLAEVCAVLRLPLEALFSGLGPGGPEKVALVGLRGAGKSTVGAALAQRLGCPFVELDGWVEQRAGMRLGEIFELRGERWFEQLEAEALEALLAQPGRCVVATGGSLVTRPETWRRLRATARTAWLQAPPAAHLQRVAAQGDLRPMRGRPEALAELEAILEERAGLYGQADLALDTAALGPAGAVERLAAWVEGR
jgi:XRE family aerobic/anaerobic benzoate catabolism transcriptional regulator